MYFGLIGTTLLILAVMFIQISDSRFDDRCDYICTEDGNTSSGVTKRDSSDDDDCDDDDQSIINGTKKCSSGVLRKTRQSARKTHYYCCTRSMSLQKPHRSSTAIQINPTSTTNLGSSFTSSSHKKISPSKPVLINPSSDDSDDNDDVVSSLHGLSSTSIKRTQSSTIPINPSTSERRSSSKIFFSRESSKSRQIITSTSSLQASETPSPIVLPSPTSSLQRTRLSSTTGIHIVNSSTSVVVLPSSSSEVLPTTTMVPINSSVYVSVHSPKISSSTVDQKSSSPLVVSSSVEFITSTSIISSTKLELASSSSLMSTVTSPSSVEVTYAKTSSVLASSIFPSSYVTPMYKTTSSSLLQTSVLTSTPPMVSSSLITTRPLSTSLQITSILPSTQSILIITSSIKTTELPVFCAYNKTGERSSKGVLTWNAIKVNKTVSTVTVKQPCPYGPVGGMAVRTCQKINTTAKWGVVNSVKCRSIPSCPAGKSGDKFKKGIMKWPTAPIFTAVKLRCPYSRGTEQIAYRWCRLNNTDFSVFWDEIHDEDCRILDVNNTNMADVNKITVTKESEIEVAVLMNAITSRSGVSVDDVSMGAEIFEDLVRVADDLGEISEELLGSISNIMEQNSTLLAKANENNGATRKILKSLNTMMENIKLNGKESMRVSTANLVAEVRDISNFTDDLAFQSNTEGEKRDLKDDVSITLPRSILKPKQRITFFNFMNDRLFAMRSVTENKFINSGVVSASVKGMEIKNLTDQVVIEFKIHDPTYADNCSCAYWDSEADNGYGNWSKNGCVFEIINFNRGRCVCNHLTHFGLLVDLFPDKPISEADHLILRTITFIGCYLSIVGLVLTIITLVSFKKFRNNISGKILLNLCLALLLFLLVFVSGIDKVETRSTCVTIGAMLHYFILVAIIWMGAEAFHLFLNVIFLPGELGTAFVVKCAIVAWVLPLIVVLITVLVKTDDYVGKQYCRVRGNSFYIAFMVPTLAIMLCNFIIFFIVIKALFTTSFPTNRQAKPHLHFRRVLGIMTIFGLTWIFGVLAVGDLRLVFQYLFCIFNSFQGFMIFFIYILSDRSVRENLVRCLCCLPTQPSNRVLTSTQLRSDIEIDMSNFEPRNRTQAWLTPGEIEHPYGYPVAPYHVPPGSRPVVNIPMPEDRDDDKLVQATYSQTGVRLDESAGPSSLRTSASVRFINEGRIVRPPTPPLPLEDVPRMDPIQERRERHRRRVHVKEPTAEELKRSDELRRLSELPEWLPRLRNFSQNLPDTSRSEDSFDGVDHLHFEPRPVSRKLPVAEDDLEHQYFVQLGTSMGHDEIVENYLIASKSTAERSGETFVGAPKPGSDSDTSSVASDHRLSELPGCLPTPKTYSQGALSEQGDERRERRHTHFEVV